MKSYATSEIRNVALVGAKGSGKTSLAEALLFTAKVTTRLGRVEDGNTVFDFEPEEHKRVASVQSALASLEWKKNKVNLLDTPGDPISAPTPRTVWPWSRARLSWSAPPTASSRRP